MVVYFAFLDLLAVRLGFCVAGAAFASDVASPDCASSDTVGRFTRTTTLRASAR
jgi:hypothetical protein